MATWILGVYYSNEVHPDNLVGSDYFCGWVGRIIIGKSNVKRLCSLWLSVLTSVCRCCLLQRIIRVYQVEKWLFTSQNADPWQGIQPEPRRSPKGWTSCESGASGSQRGWKHSKDQMQRPLKREKSPPLSPILLDFQDDAHNAAKVVSLARKKEKYKRAVGSAVCYSVSYSWILVSNLDWTETLRGRSKNYRYRYIYDIWCIVHLHAMPVRSILWPTKALIELKKWGNSTVRIYNISKFSWICSLESSRLKGDIPQCISSHLITFKLLEFISLLFWNICPDFLKNIGLGAPKGTCIEFEQCKQQTLSTKRLTHAAIICGRRVSVKFHKIAELCEMIAAPVYHVFR